MAVFKNIITLIGDMTTNVPTLNKDFCWLIVGYLWNKNNLNPNYF